MEIRWTPTAPADVIETRDHVVVEVELPGVALADILVEIDGAMLTVAAERKLDTTPGRTHHLSERKHGRVTRSFVLPVAVEGRRGRARYAAGVLVIELPKRALTNAREGANATENENGT